MKRNRTNIQVRMAQPRDAPAIASVLYRAFLEYKPAYTDAAFTATTSTSEQVQSRLNQGPVWVALYNDEVVGTVSALPRDDALYIRSMAVLPSARGNGIGELLLEHVESFAAAHGYGRLLLSTTPFLTRAIRLYERFGFGPISDGPHDLFGTPLLTMMKTVSYKNVIQDNAL